MNLFLIGCCLILALYYDKSVGSEVFHGIAFTTKQDELTKISKKIVDNLTQRKFTEVRADFSEELKGVLTPQKIGEAWEAMILQTGEFQNILATENHNVNGIRVVLHKSKFQRSNANIEVSFSSNNKVIGLWIRPLQ